MPTRTWKTTLAEVAETVDGNDCICSAGATMFTLPCADVKPGTEAVRVAVPRASVTPCTKKLASVVPLATGTSIERGARCGGVGRNQHEIGIAAGDSHSDTAVRADAEPCRDRAGLQTGADRGGQAKQRDPR